MARYMLEFTYTADAWAALVREPADRSAGMDKLCRAYGGQLVEAYYSFSDVDGVVLFDVPDLCGSVWSRTHRAFARAHQVVQDDPAADDRRDRPDHAGKWRDQLRGPWLASTGDRLTPNKGLPEDCAWRTECTGSLWCSSRPCICRHQTERSRIDIGIDRPRT